MSLNEGSPVAEYLREILLSNSIDSHTVREIVKVLRTGSGQNRIIVVKAKVKGSLKYLILDGNHRAVAMARLGLPLLCLEATRSEDREMLLQLESQGAIDHFPHRDFLRGAQSLAELRQNALTSAKEKMGYKSVYEAAMELEDSSCSSDADLSTSCRLVPQNAQVPQSPKGYRRG